MTAALRRSMIAASKLTRPRTGGVEGSDAAGPPLTVPTTRGYVQMVWPSVGAVAWDPELEELARRRAMAEAMGGPDKVERQHDGGKLTVRERIEALLDKGSFREVGSVAGKATYEAGTLTEFRPANFVMGRGRIDDRPVVVGGDDFTVRGGAADASIFAKQVHAEQMANELRLPLVRLVDGTGGGGSVKSLEEMKLTYVPRNPGWEG